MLYNKRFLIQLFLAASFAMSSCSSEDVSDGVVSQSENPPEETPTNQNPPDNTPPDDGSSMENGLPVITIEGAISNEEAQAIIDRDGGSLTTWVVINNTTQLTSIDLSLFTSLENRLVVFNNQDLEEVLLPNLENVADQIQIQVNPVLSALRLPALISTGVLEVTQNTGLDEIRLDRLETVDRISFNIVGNSNTTVDFPELRTVGREIFMAENNLKYVNFPSLETIEGRLLFSGGSVETMNFNSLNEVIEITLRDIDLLEEVNFPQLQTVTGFISGDSQLGTFTISSCANLLGVSFPILEQVTTSNFVMTQNPFLTQGNFNNLSLIDANLDFSENDAIQSIVFPLLAEVTGEVRIHNNPNLMVLDLSALTQVRGDIEVSNSFDLEVFDLDQLSSVREILFVLDTSMTITGEVDFKLSAIQEIEDLFVNKFVPQTNVELFLGSLISKNPNIQNLSVNVKGALSTTSEGYVQSLEANGNDVRIYN